MAYGSKHQPSAWRVRHISVAHQHQRGGINAMALAAACAKAAAWRQSGIAKWRISQRRHQRQSGIKRRHRMAWRSGGGHQAQQSSSMASKAGVQQRHRGE